MIMDSLLVFSKAQAVTSTADSTNILDFGAAGDAVGQELTLEVRTSAAYSGTGTLQVTLNTSADKSTWTPVVLSPAVKVSDLGAGGTVFKVRTPQGLKQYAKLSYTVSGTISAGTINAFMTKDL